MKKLYTDEKNVQVLVSLLKKHGIKRIIASPGTTNVAFVRSVQIDPYFEVFSSVDERSAAYMACGLASESGEPVVLSCTGATASRNYLPGLTEAYYRKLPVLAITSTRDVSKYGHYEDQVIDRTVLPKDVAKISVKLPTVKDNDDMWECVIGANRAIMELSRNGGGPVHINLTTTYTRSYTTKELPDVRMIQRITINDTFPELPKKRIGIFIGSHRVFTDSETSLIEKFCEVNNAVVFADHTSGYNGKYRVTYMLPVSQSQLTNSSILPELLIHIGEVSGFYHPFVRVPNEVWRISEDGELRDTFQKLTLICQMSEMNFFENYTSSNEKNTSYYETWNKSVNELATKIKDIPFSNLWIAEKISGLMPENSVIHFGILNSLSSWNYFKVDSSIGTNCNVGGFGIDGCVSSMLGASLYNKEKLYFGIVGDLAFFYDMNSLGNRHIGNNVRLMVINNGKGMEFKMKNNPAVQFGEDTNEFIAAAGHFGNKSETLIRNYAENLGFRYMSASSKEEFEVLYEDFISANVIEKPILFEIFTTDENEDNAQKKIRLLEKNIKGRSKTIVKQIIGQDNIKNIKKIIR